MRNSFALSYIMKRHVTNQLVLSYTCVQIYKPITVRAINIPFLLINHEESSLRKLNQAKIDNLMDFVQIAYSSITAGMS